MLLTDARRAAGTRPNGSLVPLAQQDRQESGPGADRRGDTCANWPATPTAAAADYLDAARRATSLPERRYLALQGARLTR